MVAAVLGLCSAAFVLAGLVKGVSGLRLPTVAIALLPLFIPPGLAAGLLAVPSLATNAWQAWRCRSFVRVTVQLLPLLAGIAVGALACPLPSVAAASKGTLALTGGVLVSYASIGLAGWRLPAPGRHERWTSAVAGVATGVMAVSSGVLAIPAAPYLQSLSLNKDDLVGSLGLTFTVCSVVLWVSLGSQAQTIENTGYSALMLVPALLGMHAGAHLRGRLSEPMIRRVFLCVLLLLGSYSLFRAVEGWLA